MGLFDNLFKKKEVGPVPTLRDGTPKTFDYFAFKVHGTSAPDSQNYLSKLENKLYEQPPFVSVKLENDSLNVYFNKTLIGHGDTRALNKFTEHCVNKRYSVHSLAIYGGDEGKYFGCKVRIKYYYH